MPPVNAYDPLTDEDSGDAEQPNINNLPRSQLRATSELVRINSIAQYSSSNAEATHPLVQESNLEYTKRTIIQLFFGSRH